MASKKIALALAAAGIMTATVSTSASATQTDDLQSAAKSAYDFAPARNGIKPTVVLVNRDHHNYDIFGAEQHTPVPGGAVDNLNKTMVSFHPGQYYYDVWYFYGQKGTLRMTKGAAGGKNWAVVGRFNRTDDKTFVINP